MVILLTACTRANGKERAIIVDSANGVFLVTEVPTLASDGMEKLKFPSSHMDG